MGRVTFQFLFLISILLDFGTVFCLPCKPFTALNELNNTPYFYYGGVQKVLLESDLRVLLNNFDQVSFELVKYLKFDDSCFHRCDPKEHYNLILNLKDNYINYYYSFPFSYNKDVLYYNYLYQYDWFGRNKDQYWRPYIGVYDKNYVKVNKLNLNPNNYMVSTDLRFKIYNVLKMYVNK